MINVYQISSVETKVVIPADWRSDAECYCCGRELKDSSVAWGALTHRRQLYLACADSEPCQRHVLRLLRFGYLGNPLRKKGILTLDDPENPINISPKLQYEVSELMLPTSASAQARKEKRESMLKFERKLIAARSKLQGAPKSQVELVKGGVGPSGGVTDHGAPSMVAGGGDG